MLLKSITQSITTPTIQKTLSSSRKHNFNSVCTAHFKTRKVVNTTSIPYVLHTLKHVKLSERAVYTELELCSGLKQIFISTECGVGYHTSKTTITYQKAHKK